MKTLLSKAILLTLLLSTCNSLMAQQVANLDDAIKSLINNIGRLEATPVPVSMQATHRQNINEQRIDLIALLGQKKGEVESYFAAVSANLRPDQTEKLSQQLNDLSNQIALQKKALMTGMSSTEAAAAAVVEGSSSPNDGNDNAADSGKGNGAKAAEKETGAALLMMPLRPLDPAVSSAAIASPASNNAALVEPAADSSTLSGCAAVLLAPNSYSIREQQICDLVQDVADNKLGLTGAPAVPDAGLSLEGSETFIVNIITETKVLGDVEDTRTDKQTGTDAQGKGTTSLVMKGGTPAILSWAVENGAAVASTSGTTINFRFNPLGMIHALNNTGYFASYDTSESDPFTKFLRKTSFGVSFDASRGDEPGIFTGKKQQIAGFSARYEFVSDRDPRNKKYASDWDNLVDEQQIDYTNAAVKLRNAIVEKFHCADPNVVRIRDCPAAQLVKARFKDVKLQAWLDETNKQLAAKQYPVGTSKNTVIADVEGIIRKQFGLLSVDKIGADTRNQIISFVESLGSYLKARESLLDKIAKGKVMAFEYTNHREVNAPDTSNFMFIAEKGTVGRMDLTFNASLNMYNKRPTSPNVKRIRDFVFAGQFDAPITEISGVGKPVFSIAGRYERTTSDAFALDGTLVPNTKGDVGSLQLKFLLPIKGTGIKLPFSVTFANRSELIKEKEVRTNFGFTFDLDRLFANNPFFKK